MIFSRPTALICAALLAATLLAGCSKESDDVEQTRTAAPETPAPLVDLGDGLSYRVLRAGTGASPTLSDVIRVDYRGTLADGTVFDSSYQRGEPADFPLVRLIPGWQKAIPLMKEGAKWELHIPAALAYGEKGAGDLIPPNAPLTFEIELIKVLPPAQGQE